MLPHHAIIFMKHLYEKGAEGLAQYLAYNREHRTALERNY